MRTDRLIWAAIAVSVLGICGVLSAGDSARRECAVCGMWMDQYERTRVLIVQEDGQEADFCSIACAARYLRDGPAGAGEIRVADYPSKRLIGARGAHYVSGSDLPGVMTYTSRLAFEDVGEAGRFMAERGGRLITFDEALAELAAE